MSDFLFQEIDTSDLDEVYEGWTEGDMILESFVNGNFSINIQELKENSISAREFLEYYRQSMFNEHEHFSEEFWVLLGEKL